MRFQATPLTSGNVTPGKEQPGTRTWRWHGKPPGWPFDPATHDDKGTRESPKGGAVARSAQREANIKLFAAARAEGLGVMAAGARVGVKAKTARRYEKERLATLQQCEVYPP